MYCRRYFTSISLKLIRDMAAPCVYIQRGQLTGAALSETVFLLKIQLKKHLPICFRWGQRGISRGAGPIFVSLIQHNGMDRFDQINHGGAIYQGYTLPIHHGETAAPIIAV